jgi:hypothetical protein
VSVFTERSLPGSYSIRLDNRISTETDVYLYQSGQASEFPSLGLTRSRRPTNVSPQPFGERVGLYSRRANLGYFKENNI